MMKTRQYFIFFACASITTAVIAMEPDLETPPDENTQLPWRIELDKHLLQPDYNPHSFVKSWLPGQSLRTWSSQAVDLFVYDKIETTDDRTSTEITSNKALQDQALNILTIYPKKDDNEDQVIALNDQFHGYLDNIAAIDDRRDKTCWILNRMRKHNLAISGASVNALCNALITHSNNHNKLALLVQAEIEDRAQLLFQAYDLALRLARKEGMIGLVEKFDTKNIEALTTYLPGQESDLSKHFNIKNLEEADFTQSVINPQTPDYIQAEEDFENYIENSNNPWQTATIFAYLTNQTTIANYNVETYVEDLQKNKPLAENDINELFDTYRKAFVYTLAATEYDDSITSRWWVHLESMKTLIPLMFIAQKSWGKVEITTGLLQAWQKALLDYAYNGRELLREVLTKSANELARDLCVLKAISETCEDTDSRFYVPDADLTDPKLIVSQWFPGLDPATLGIYQTTDFSEPANLEEFTNYEGHENEYDNYSNEGDDYYENNNLSNSRRQ